MVCMFPLTGQHILLNWKPHLPGTWRLSSCHVWNVSSKVFVQWSIIAVSSRCYCCFESQFLFIHEVKASIQNNNIWKRPPKLKRTQARWQLCTSKNFSALVLYKDFLPVLLFELYRTLTKISFTKSCLVVLPRTLNHFTCVEEEKRTLHIPPVLISLKRFISK